jgi:NAD(P)-dependent dehydrogenase (short-subunit alcohol dehydrogenase family)
VRVFLAGASGVIGIRLLPLLVEQGHVVAAMTRSSEKAEQLHGLGGEPVVGDVFDADRLTESVTRFRPDAVMHQVTDLPDRLEDLDAAGPSNDRIRTEGTRNLIAAALAAAAGHFVAQSIAWRPPARGGVVDLHEQRVLEIGGVVARYGRLYGPGTYYEAAPPPRPRIQIDDAVRATPPLLEAPSGIVTLVEPERS